MDCVVHGGGYITCRCQVWTVWSTVVVTYRAGVRYRLSGPRWWLHTVQVSGMDWVVYGGGYITCRDDV